MSEVPLETETAVGLGRKSQKECQCGWILYEKNFMLKVSGNEAVYTA